MYLAADHMLAQVEMGPTDHDISPILKNNFDFFTGQSQQQGPEDIREIPHKTQCFVDVC